VAGPLAGMRRGAEADVRFAAGVPNVGPFGDPLLLTDLAVAAEDSGWDAFFIWDHLLYRDQRWPVADPTVVIAAVAARTSRIRFGVLMNQLARRRVGKVARESATLDRLSGGRLIPGAGLGSVPGEFTAFGEPGDLRERAARLDESLEVLTELWRGEPVTFHGEHVTVTGVTMLPPPLQQPRIPIWCGGRWPAKTPFRRAARWDDLAAVLRYIREHRQDGAPPLAVALEGRTDGAAADRGGRHVAAYREAGLTWWVEALGWWRCDPAGAMARIRQGPPRLN
jgi:alkanesulfonate monooxygenase SsuD/methylene tetrahydromethanopterin reductase-like flavin-dependent oxidoreductase (luciferase family)